jgi:CTP:molybdopterin cytidylyltransferase MocA
MGRPKALLKQAGQPLIVDHIQALEKRCAEVVVVLGAHASDIASVLPRTTRIVLNPKWETTELRDSLRMGLANLNGSVLITPVDVPPAPEHVLDALIKTGAPSVPVYANQTGHPVFVDAVQTEQQLHSFRLDHIIASATKTEVDWPHTVLNINTPEQWKSYLSD